MSGCNNNGGGAVPPPPHIRPFCFFKFMIGDFKRRLRIPVAAKGLFRDFVNEFVGIEDTNGQVWQVRVSSDSTNEFLDFEQGWPEFVLAHSIRVGELVLFMPVRAALLCAQIFSTNACPRLDFGAGRGKPPPKCPSMGSSDSRSHRLRTRDDCLEAAGCGSDDLDRGGLAMKKKRVAKTEGNEPPFIVFVDPEPIAVPAEPEVSTGSGKVEENNPVGSPFIGVNVDDVCIAIERSAVEEMPVCEVLMGNQGQRTNTISLFELLHPETTEYSEPNPDRNLDVCLSRLETTGLPGLKIDDDRKAKSSSEASREVHAAPQNPDFCSVDPVDLFCTDNNASVPNCISEACTSSSFLRGDNDDHASAIGKRKHASTTTPPPSFHESPRRFLHQPEGLVVDSAARSFDDILEDARTIAAVPDACPMQSSCSFCFSVGTNDSSWIKLPEKLPFQLGEMMQAGKVVVVLEDPTKRLWPVLYCERNMFAVFIGGWEEFAAANGLESGDTCDLRFAGPSKTTFQVLITRRVQ